MIPVPLCPLHGLFPLEKCDRLARDFTRGVARVVGSFVEDDDLEGATAFLLRSTAGLKMARDHAIYEAEVLSELSAIAWGDQ